MSLESRENSTAAAATGKRSGKFLSFMLSSEKYGVEILKVQEIIGVMHITRVPRSPDYVKGVINLRGKIIPVVDLRLKFGLEPQAYDERTCIIVVEATVQSRSLAVGLVVDTVLEVSHFQPSDVEPAPDYGTHVESSFILGMGRCPDASIMILIDIDKALEDAGLQGLTAPVEEPAA